MEEVQKMRMQPQILINQKIEFEIIAQCVGNHINIDASRIFLETISKDVDYNELFDFGYMVVNYFSKGQFLARLDGFFDDGKMTDVCMTGLSKCFGALVCVDLSVSESEPRFDAYFLDRKYEHIKVFEREDENSDPYYVSEQVREIIRNSAGS